jgi:hypothetical protein
MVRPVQLVVALLLVLGIGAPACFAGDATDRSAKELLDAHARETWAKVKERSQFSTEWRRSWIERLVAFADAHPDSAYAPRLLGQAVSEANSMGDRKLASELSGRISSKVLLPEEKARWKFDRGEVLRLAWNESLQDSNRLNAISCFGEAADLWGKAALSAGKDEYRCSQFVGDQLYANYRKALLLKVNPLDWPKAMLVFQEASRLALSATNAAGKMLESGLTVEHLLAEAFHLACELKDRGVAGDALAELQSNSHQVSPVGYVIDYARAFMADKPQDFSNYLMDWFEVNHGSKRAFLALYYAAEKLFTSNERKAAFEIYHRLLAECREELEDSEVEVFRKGEAGPLGNVLYNTALCEADKEEFAAAVKHLKEFTDRYPNDKRKNQVETLSKQFRAKVRSPSVGRWSAVVLLAMLIPAGALVYVVFSRRRSTG